MTKSAKRFFSTITLVLLLITLLSWNSPKTSGATLVQVSDTLSRLMINTSSTHTILFKTPSGLLASQKLKIAFPYAGGGFSFGSATGTFNVVNDIDVASSTAVGGTYTDYTLSTGTAAAVGSIAVATTTASGLLWFTFYAPSNMSIPSSTWLRIRIGTNAGSGGVGAVSMINPSPATSSLVTITTTDASDNIIDRGYLSLAIITNDQVAITATVLPTLTFDWNATSTGTVGSENCAAANSMASSSNKNAIDFGALTPAVAKIGCHFLFVGTNASQGYSVTAQQNHDLWQNGSTTMTISPFKNGVPQTAPAAWASPSGTYGSHLTYGHFGFTSSDTALSSSTPNVFNTGASFAGFSSTSSMEIMYHTGPTATTTGNGIGSATVVYKIEISAFQEAGDYSNAVTYIATATF